jgi:uncharacterized protein
MPGANTEITSIGFWMRRPIRILSAVLLGASIGINAAAFMQARAMTHFADGGERTARPERLSIADKTAVLFSGVNIPRPQNRRTPADVSLIYETHRFASQNAASLEAWYIPAKAALPLIALFHGYAASKSSLLSTAQVFHELGYATLLVDFYGSGGSSGSGTTIGVNEANDVAAAVAYIRPTWPNRQVVLYGISMGGAAILRAIASENMKSDAIIIEATFDSLLNTGKNRFKMMDLPGTPFGELLLFWGSVQQGFNFFSHNPVDYARSIKCRALVLHGEKDERVTVEQARAIADAMGKNARFVSVAGVPHMPIVEARPVEWTQAVRDFLKSNFQ